MGVVPYLGFNMFLTLFKSEQSVDKDVCFSADRLNHVATKSNLSLTAASCRWELCSSVFQWGIKTPTEKLNGTLPPIGGESSHRRQTRLI